ncbi:recombinase family protein [Corynebacterium accolens]|uniref:recombinase family protein n=1 Tax=Corynebacterium accolens TaxID=38284 RepID=UPI002542B640|nr:recombinase family protein [Corynebacterium accolens]MDK4232393.1 recombinase family protein [Corynebacterium accolens]
MSPPTARVSTDLEEQQSSYHAQVDYYTRYINEHAGWQLVGIYTDEGITGTSTKHREGFKQMITDALDGKIDLIITKSVSRFARNTVDTLTHVRLLKDRGVEVYFEKENIWTLDSKGELLITIMSSLAQEESRSISENVTWGHRKRFVDGKVMVPYKSLLGYKKGADGNLAIDEERAPVVREIYGLFLAGKSIREIKDTLETEGHLTPRGKTTWHVTTTRSILSNEKYKGDALLQKTYTADFLTKTIKRNDGEVAQYYVTGNHAPIIGPEVWDQVQYELATRHGEGSGSKLHLFSSRLKCADCGGWYGRKTWSSTTNKHTVWHCNNKHAGDQVCATPTLRDHQIKTTFLTALSQLGPALEAPSLREDLAAVFDTKQLEAEREDLAERQAELEAAFTAMVAHNQHVATDQDEYTKQIKRIETDYNHATDRLKNLETQSNERQVKHNALLAAYDQLSRAPVSTFQPTQWTALIDQTTVREEAIKFFFRDGRAISVDL